MSDYNFHPACLLVQKGDVIKSKLGILTHSELTGEYYRVTKFVIAGINDDKSVIIDALTSEPVDANPVENKNEVKSCPFCGAGANKYHEAGQMFWIACDACGVTVMPRPTPEEALDIWNARV
jgi:hypothetical protein